MVAVGSNVTLTATNDINSSTTAHMSRGTTSTLETTLQAALQEEELYTVHYSNCKPKVVQLSEVLHVLAITKNLLSASYLAQAELVIKLSVQCTDAAGAAEHEVVGRTASCLQLGVPCHMYNPKNGQVIFKPIILGQMIAVGLHLPKHPNKAYIVTDRPSLTLLHQHLRHTSERWTHTAAQDPDGL
jgi:hypothetical protein